MAKPAKIVFTLFKDEADGSSTEEEVELPAKFEVCPRCHGHGKHDHPAFSNGITSDERAEWDDEEWELYRGGFYDVVCEKCQGENVVAVLDEERADPTMVVAYHEHLRQKAEWAAEEAMERRYGA